MQKLIKGGLLKYADVLGQAAFLLSAIHEHACADIDKDLPLELQTKLNPEIIRFQKSGRLQIVWRTKRISEYSGETYYSRIWPRNPDGYTPSLLESVAQPNELKLVRKMEKCFALIRRASATLTVLNNSAKELDAIAYKLSSLVRDLHEQYQDLMHDVEAEEVLAGFKNVQNTQGNSAEHTAMDDA